MDRRVKERLVGAAILVGVVVAVAPELLSGHKPAAPPPAATAAQGPVRTYTVDFAENAGPSQARETSAAAAGAVAGADSAAAPPVAASTAADAATARESAAAGSAAAGAVAGMVARPAHAGGAEQSGGALPQADANAAAGASGANTGKGRGADPSAGHGSWYVQLGSFATQANAQKLGRELHAQGFVVLESTSGTGKTLRHRVRVGPLADRDAAAQVAAKLKAEGHSASLVPPTG